MLFDVGITKETEWTGTIVVSHYLFFSEDWEMHVEWHIMIAPDDWARIDLRKRFCEETVTCLRDLITRRQHNPNPD